MKIIICTYNRKEIYKTIESLLSFEIFQTSDLIIIDNYGDNRLKLFCDNLGVNYYFEKKTGLSFARNLGLKLTKNQWVYFFDDDITFTKKLLLSLKLKYKKNNIIYSLVKPSKKPKINGFLLTGDLLSALSVHGEKIFPLGCSFGFYNKSTFMFNENLGRFGRKLIGGEENELIRNLIKFEKRNLKLIDGFVFHKIESKLNQDYVNRYYLYELKKGSIFKLIRFLIKIIFLKISKNNNVLLKALIFSVKNKSNENIS